MSTSPLAPSIAEPVPQVAAAPASLLTARAERAVEQARARGRAVHVAASVRLGAVDPLALLAGARADEPTALLERGGELALAGWGEAARIVVSGADRAARAAMQARALFDDVLADPDAPELAAPRLLGGFAFDHLPARAPRDGEPDWGAFGAARLLLPRRLAARAGEGETWLTAIVTVTPTDEVADVTARLRKALVARPVAVGGAVPAAAEVPGETRERWAARVQAARSAIASGVLGKVVLGQAVHLTAEAPIAPAALVAALRASQPGCLAFCFGLPGAGTFVGATPERLVAVRGLEVTSGALAGSIARGANEAADAELAARLLGSDKERGEHRHVVDAVRAALGDLVALPQERPPEVVRFAQVQHLFTPIEGQLAGPRHVLELLGRLHPTPAVAGTSRRAALAHLRRHEALERGWYAGAVGWLDARGDGDFAVALRSAFVREREAWLYAAAGIVAGSDPDAEWDEVRMKLRAVGSLFRS